MLGMIFTVLSIQNNIAEFPLDRSRADDGRFDMPVRSAISKLFKPLVTGGAKPEQLAYQQLHKAVVGHVTVFLHKPE